MNEQRLPLSEQEKTELKTTRNGSAFVAVLMFLIIVAVAYFALDMMDGAFFWIFLFFILFFLLVLGIIVYTHVSNSNQREKIVFTGKVTDKKTDTSRMRGSSLEEYYAVQLDNQDWFTVGQPQFDKLHNGDNVSLHCLRSRYVFRVEVIAAAEEERIHIHHRRVHDQQQRNAVSYSSSSSSSLTKEEKDTLRSAFFRAAFLRGVAGFIGCYVLYYVVVIVGMLLIPEKYYSFISVLIYGAYFISIGLFVLMNRKTIRLLRDLNSEQKVVAEEVLVDKIRSNTLKPGPHSVMTTQNYGPDTVFFYYFQTKNSWLRVEKETFERFETGDTIRIVASKRAKLFLGVE